MTPTIAAPVAAAKSLSPGLLLCATIGAAASFLSEHYGGPAMLFALLLGMAFNFLSEEGPCKAGVAVASKTVLRLGVALLGLRITFGDIAALGAPTLATVACLVALTIASGFAIAPLMGRQWRFALMTGGAVAICGASAALAIASVIPHNDKTERNTLFTVIAVTTLSTVAMVAYPVLFSALKLSDVGVGFMIGATIHDVAQVVGAGYSVSERAGDVAAIVKLFRVALLPVALIAIALILRANGAGAGGAPGAGKAALIPWFLAAFLALAAINSLVALPQELTAVGDAVSRGFLVTAIAALGVKTSIKALLQVGSGHVWIVVLETVFLLCAALLAVHFVLDL